MLGETGIIISNPYWERVKKLFGNSNGGLRYRLDSYMLRRDHVHRFSWAIPDPETLTFVAEWAGKRVVEMGAGMGYWAYLLSQLGIDIIAYDRL